MLFSDLIRRKNRDEIRGRGGFFYAGSAGGILALNQAHNAGHFEAVLAGSFNGLHGGGSGGAYIVHDNHLRAFFAEAFDALAGAMLLLGLTDQEAVHSSTG